MKPQFRNSLIAAVLAGIVILWLASGVLLRPGSGGSAGGDGDSGQDELFTVAVSRPAAELINRRISLQGETRPDRSVVVRARTAGTLETVSVETGDRVAEGEDIARIALDDRPARLEEARALLRERRESLQAKEKLQRQGYESGLDIDAARAALEAARARVESIQTEIGHTRIQAPFAGQIAERHVTGGDVIGVGAAVVTLVDNTPLKVLVHVSENNIERINAGESVDVQLPAVKENLTGRITSVAPQADAATRTFPVEVTLAGDGALPSGGTATVHIPIGEVLAHRVSPSMLALDDDGQLGLKTVDEDDRVRFVPVEIVRSGADGIWVTGLPEAARLITRGGGFVSVGERVRTRPDGEVPD